MTTPVIIYKGKLKIQDGKISVYSNDRIYLVSSQSEELIENLYKDGDEVRYRVQDNDIYCTIVCPYCKC